MSTNIKLVKIYNTFLAKLTFLRLRHHYGKKSKKKKLQISPILYPWLSEFFHFLSAFKNNGLSFLQQH